ncbi:hypothetical protein SAMN04489712_11993 [Thermomonospora echinospora]|uniref:Uncharacterized protein n=1 Tax=Thermomonospora echinospora TaxID=1992 RepID=A0A1H6DML0_9ACTN|nr:hypothetical protein [Thermomonospora echinospora]SEG86478.1 hypothetical protein SAMN04489712_11993 [Thermomonospora echinospora]
MLIEAPPYYLIDGVTIMRDHADPLQFYYLPLRPSLVTRPEGGREVPRFSLLKWHFDERAGGFADFDVHLGMTPRALADVRGELARLARLEEEPRLAPLPVVDGSVTLMLFGERSGDAGGGGFVRAIRHPARPALFGDNVAAFSVELDEVGVSVLDAAMDLVISPIGVVYSLDYLALRPAYHVRLGIDWDRTQEIMDSSFGHEGLFTSLQIEDVVERLVEQRAVVLEVDTTVPEDPADETTGTLRARRDAAVARVRDMITDAFFESSLDPLRREPDGWDRAREVIRSLSPQRSTPSGVFTYNKTHYTRVDAKRLDVDFSERITVRRTIYPQGHLDGLFGAVNGFDRGRHVKVIDGNDLWFRRRRVKVVSNADFEADPIRSMTATLTYQGDIRTVHLDKDHLEGEVTWPIAVAGGQPVKPVALKFSVDLQPSPDGERPTTLHSGTEEVLGEISALQPRALFTRETVPVLTLPGFPWERYPVVEVELRYDDPGHQVRQHDIVRLTQQQPDGTWERFVVGAPVAPATARITYRAVDHRDHVTAPAPVLRPQVDVSDPFPMRLKVDVVPALDWNMVERAFVDLFYDDPPNGIHVEDSVELAQGQPVRPFLADRVDPSVSLVRYRITLLMRDTTIIEGPQSSTLGRRIIVQTRIRGHRSATLRAPADFAGPGLARVRVQARAADPLAGLSFAEDFEFTAPGASGVFEFDFADPAADAFELRVQRFFTNGLTSVRDWRPFDADVVTV